LGAKGWPARYAKLLFQLVGIFIVGFYQRIDVISRIYAEFLAALGYFLQVLHRSLRYREGRNGCIRVCATVLGYLLQI
jgi:hypothetical protein